MLNVFICEDNKKQLDKFTKIIRDTIMIEDFDMQVVLSTVNPYQVLEYIQAHHSAGIYFLDVDLGCDINGIKLGEKIRRYDPRGFIIYITTHAEMSYLTFSYKVEALDYIIKDNFDNVKNRIRQCILNANEKYSAETNDLQKNFYIKSNDKVVHIEYNKILFFETSSTVHKITVHAVDRQIEFYGHMKDIAEKVDERFHRCHRSYLVNKDKIKEIDKKNRVVYLVNGQKCLVSVRGMRGLC